MATYRCGRGVYCNFNFRGRNALSGIYGCTFGGARQLVSSPILLLLVLSSRTFQCHWPNEFVKSCLMGSNFWSRRGQLVSTFSVVARRQAPEIKEYHLCLTYATNDFEKIMICLWLGWHLARASSSQRILNWDIGLVSWPHFKFIASLIIALKTSVDYSMLWPGAKLSGVVTMRFRFLKLELLDWQSGQTKLNYYQLILIYTLNAKGVCSLLGGAWISLTGCTEENDISCFFLYLVYRPSFPSPYRFSGLYTIDWAPFSLDSWLFMFHCQWLTLWGINGF